MESGGVYKCPDDSTTGAGAGEVYISYIYNVNMEGGKATNGIPGGSIASLNSPAVTVMLCEGSVMWGDVTNQTNFETGSTSTDGADYIGTPGGSKLDTGPMGNPANTTAAQDTAFPTGRHTDGSEFLLTDGHVKYLKGIAVSSGYMALSPTNGQVTSPAPCTAAKPCAAGTGRLGWFVEFRRHVQRELRRLASVVGTGGSPRLPPASLSLTFKADCAPGECRQVRTEGSGSGGSAGGISPPDAE